MLLVVGILVVVSVSVSMWVPILQDTSTLMALRIERSSLSSNNQESLPAVVIGINAAVEIVVVVTVGHGTVRTRVGFAMVKSATTITR